MTGILTVLAFALLPVCGNLVGSLLAESLRAPRWLIGASLHGAAGIAIALVSIDLMPRIMASTPAWIVFPAFLAGAVISVALFRGSAWARRRAGAGSPGAWMVYIAVWADLVGDGLMTGAGTAVGTELGLLLASSQAVANIPGGFAATANFRDDRLGRKRRIAMSVSLAAPALVAAALGYVLMRGETRLFQDGALAVIVGVLLLATVEDVIPQGDEPRLPRWISTAAFAGGFAAMGLLSVLLR